MTAAASRGIAPVAARDVRVIPGRGIRGSIDGEPVAAGSQHLMSDLGWPLPPALAERARVAGGERPFGGLCRLGGRVQAVLSLDDTPLPEARATIAALRGRGLASRC